MLLNDFFTFRRTDFSCFEHCCVPLCNSSSKYNAALTFHKFPSDPELRRTWIESIQREKLHVSRYSRVCSRHFTGGDFQEDGRLLQPGAVPVLFEWNQYSVPGGVKAEGPAEGPEGPEGPAEEPEAFLTEHNYALASETGLKERVERLTGGHRLGHRFGLQRFAGSDEDIRFFTRFASYDLLMGFWTSVEHFIPLLVDIKNSQTDVVSESVSSLQLIDEMFLLLNYLSLGSKLEDLADRYRIRPSAVGRIITTWSDFLYAVLGSVNIWIPQEGIRERLPAVFEDYPDTTVILSRLELRFQRPSSSLLEAEGVSVETPPRPTLRGLFGVAPHGAVTFVSRLFSGSVSDAQLIRESGIRTLLRPGMGVMLDRSLPVDDLPMCRIYTPDFLSHRPRTRARDVREMLVGVHVERLISRVEDHSFMDSEIPMQLLGSINQIYTVGCLLSNYENGLLGKTEG